MSIHDLHGFEARLASRLLGWGTASVAGGAALALVGQATGSRFLRAFGSQSIGWGAIDAGLALGGRARARRLLAGPVDPAAAAAEAARIRRILAINAGLDVLYVAGGLAVAVGRGRSDPAARGHGLAAVAQGAFLLAFDAWHAARVPAAAADEAAV
jgi:hypothetical protein